MVQQPVLEGSGSIDIGHLLRQLLPVDAGIGETGQPMSESDTVDNRASGKHCLIRGGGLVTRISDNKEPQVDDYRKYCERPVRKKDSVTHSMYDNPGVT